MERCWLSHSQPDAIGPTRKAGQDVTACPFRPMISNPEVVAERDELVQKRPHQRPSNEPLRAALLP